jgi:putative ABC transport system permease protein
MFSVERWSEVFEAIGKNKLRTFLTGFSVAIGILILVLLLGVGEGMKNGIELQFAQDAQNRVEMWSGVTTVEYKGLNPGREVQFKNQDYDLIVRNYQDDLEYKSSKYRRWVNIFSYKENSSSYRIEGVLPDYQFLENAGMVQGRFINQQDQDRFTKNVVIGKKVRDELFKKEDPLGKLIKSNGVNYKVVGVYQDPGGDREESRVFLPLSTMQKVYGAGNDISSLSFTLPKSATYEEAVAKSTKLVSEIESLLKSRHTVAPEDTSGVNYFNTIEEAKKFYDLMFNMKIFFWVVGIASLFAGIIGVSNIMLIIVQERTKEIGIRKALGAQPNSIIWMILHESIFVTAISGFVGLVLGLLILEAVGSMIQTEFISNPEVNLNVAISTVIVLVVAGAIAGFFPARRGAKIKPIVALRDE